MTVSWIALLVAVFVLGVTVSTLMLPRRRKPTQRFEPLPPIEGPPKLIASYPRKPAPAVTVVDETVFHDGELEGWFPPDDTVDR